jgi:DNA-binding transcriptional ArsR family regulator
MKPTRATAVQEHAETPSPTLASVGALLGDPVRAEILRSLTDGRTRPASELAFLAGASPQAASAHLAQLVDGGLLSVENRGRNRFFSLASGEVAEMIEALDNWADRQSRRIHRDPALCKARLCYDHLAGHLGVAVFDRMAAQGWLTIGPDGPALSPSGQEWCESNGFDCVPPAASRRPLLRLCLDWTERRHHIGGHFGAAFARRLLDRGYLRRHAAQRALAITPPGRDFLRRELAIDLAD